MLTRVMFIGNEEGFRAEFTLTNGQSWAGPYPTFAAPSEMQPGDSVDMNRQKVDVVFYQGKWTVTGPLE